MVENYLEQKLFDLEVPGVEVDFDPQEAEQLGAFSEDAVNYDAAAAATLDLFEGE